MESNLICFYLRTIGEISWSRPSPPEDYFSSLQDSHRKELISIGNEEPISCYCLDDFSFVFREMTQCEIQWFFEVDVSRDSQASVLDRVSDWAETTYFYAHILIFIGIYYTPCRGDARLSFGTGKRTIGDTHFSLGMVPFHSGIENRF